MRSVAFRKRLALIIIVRSVQSKFAIGRRNWLFAKSIRGADASAVVYSIAETALLNGLKPYVYLSYVLDELRKWDLFQSRMI